MPPSRVSFVVPCYKLAHLLPECVDSILSQTYGDFEVLIMDDCSPDATAEVARSFGDRRVRHIRNTPNLGHLRNYNKGISEARGAYIWLISADDYLRTPYILERYVALLEGHPEIGYVICPGFGVRDGRETRELGRYRRVADRDRIIPGPVMLRKLLRSNFVLAPSGLVRRECYTDISLFPLHMPWAGDWYLWCLFALYYDVGYFAEPMICYREHHQLSMTTMLTRERLEACAAEEVAIPWAIRAEALKLGRRQAAKDCLRAIAQTYARTLGNRRFRDTASFMNVALFEEALERNLGDEDERRLVRAHFYADLANECYWGDEPAEAKALYRKALETDPRMATVHIKWGLLSLGAAGDYLRRKIVALH